LRHSAPRTEPEASIFILSKKLRVVDALTPCQRQALDIVQKEPGIRIKDMATRLRVTHATATFHLTALARLGRVTQLRDGRDVRNFPTRARPSPSEYLAALLLDPRKAAVLRMLASADMPFLTMSQGARRIGVSFGFFKRTVRQAHWGGLVSLERRSYRYSVKALPPLLELNTT
jgi:DNA-binding MarR family transcriptional regulator